MKNKEIFVDHGKATRLQCWVEACGRWGNGEEWRQHFEATWLRRGGRQGNSWRHYDCRQAFFFFFLIALNFSLFSEPAIIFNKSVALQMFFPLLAVCLPSCSANWRAFIYSKPSSNFILPDVFLGYSKQSQSFWSPCSTTWLWLLLMNLHAGL